MPLSVLSLSVILGASMKNEKLAFFSKMDILYVDTEVYMVAITFDTLAFSKRLQESGMPQNQAETLANAQKDALNEMVAAQELVTKKDLHVALAEVKNDLLKWFMGLLIAQSALLVAVITLLN